MSSTKKPLTTKQSIGKFSVSAILPTGGFAIFLTFVTNEVAKNIISTLLPTITLIIDSIVLFIYLKILNYFYFRNLAERETEIEKDLSNQHTSESHKNNLRKKLEDVQLERLNYQESKANGLASVLNDDSGT